MKGLFKSTQVHIDNCSLCGPFQAEPNDGMIPMIHVRQSFVGRFTWTVYRDDHGRLLQYL